MNVVLIQFCYMQPRVTESSASTVYIYGTVYGNY